MSDPFTSHKVTVGIKSGGGYDATLTAFDGSPAQVKAMMAEYFGLEVTAEMTAHEVQVLAEQSAQGVKAIRSIGGTLKTESDATDDSEQDEHEDGGQEQEAPKLDYQWLVDLINDQPTADDLRRLWAENREHFKAAPSLMDAYKSRGQQLTKK